jgi:GntR family transcriptional regulator / MocR family aminotransferase
MSRRPTCPRSRSMAKQVRGLLFSSSFVNAAQTGVLHRQVYEKIRSDILAGRIRPGTRLPSTRTLAEEIGVSRSTIKLAFEHLIADALVESFVGAGTYVVAQPGMRTTHRASLRGGAPELPAVTEMAWKTYLAAPKTDTIAPRQAFEPRIPSLDDFPHHIWHRLVLRALRRRSKELLDRSETLGLESLREVLAEHLATAHGVLSPADQIVIFSSAQQALDVSARIFVERGTRVLVEDPGFVRARLTFAAAGGALEAVAIDKDGFPPPETSVSPAHLALVSSATQYPTGIVTSVERRHLLVEWARDTNGVIIEDARDADYWYDGTPPPSYHSVAAGERVIYIGTFSKIVYPALHLAYAVVPKALVKIFRAAKQFADNDPPNFSQTVLRDFIAEGHLATYLRLTRRDFACRQTEFLEAAAALMPTMLQFQHPQGGLHVLGELPAIVDDVALAAKLNEQEIAAKPLSDLCLAPPKRRGLIFGYTSVPRRDLPFLVEKIARIIEGSIEACTV